MSRLAEGLAQLFGRVEILARGADDLRRSAARALAAGRALEARQQARALLVRVPRSPLGLALWADAAEAAGLDDEAALALAQLTEEAPWERSIWLRLGMAKLRLGDEDARKALERASLGGADLRVSRQALLILCDLDLRAGDARRALRWLDRIASPAGETDRPVLLRRAECFSSLGDLDRARKLSARLGEPDRADGRDRLVLARTAGRSSGGATTARVLELALAAYILDAPGAAGFLARQVAATRAGESDPIDDRVGRVNRVLCAQGRDGDAEWSAAFAMADGRVDEARAQLMQLLARGERGAAATLLDLATERRDVEALLAVEQRQRAWISPAHGRLLDGVRLHRQGCDRQALDQLESAAGTEAGPWAASLVEEIVSSWVPQSESGRSARWVEVLAELRDAARSLDRLELVTAIEGLAIEGDRPLRVVLVGEFNAGKSTLLNALLGIDVAPTGVRPTTASLHWVAWAPDPFARVVVQASADRVVAHHELKRALSELSALERTVEKVFIYAPIERLKRIELLDTPGFNSPHRDHTAIAEAGVREAHLALWLLDATVPLKDTERRAIERIVAGGVPVQVLVNKSDRVPQAKLGEVMAYIERSLLDLGIESYRSPVAFSARLALRGRLGDDQALGRSNWHEVERLLAKDIVDRCETLREQSRRRRAATVARELGELAQSRACSFERALASHRRRADALLQHAAQLEADRTRAVPELIAALSGAIADLDADARPVEQLAGRRPRRDTELRDYLVDCTVARLAPALTEAIGEAAAAGATDRSLASSELCEIIEVPVGLTVAGAAAAHRSGVVLSRGALGDTVDAALRASAARLRAAAAAPAAEPATAVLPWRLAALAAALD